jgi:hypothetical protein
MFDELWDILIKAVANLSGNIVCVLDALDECHKEDRDYLISAMATYYRKSQPSSPNKGEL